jgi:hypothetical protein
MDKAFISQVLVGATGRHTPLLDNADALLRRRARGNHLLPKRDVTLTAELRSGLELKALRRWTYGEPPADLSKRPWIATKIYEALSPALRAAAWPRWLFLSARS